MRRVLILGGGFGGVATAHALRARLPEEDEIVLVDRRSHFMVGFRKAWALMGNGTLDEGQRPLEALKGHGIEVIQETITAIDPEARAIEVGGQRMEGDALVVALGARVAPEAMPGFAEHALNVYDREHIPAANAAIQNFKGGRVMVGIFGLPYKCPPAPYEIALALQAYFKDREVSAEVEVFTPQPMSLPVLGDAGCNVLEGRLSAHGVGFLPNRKASEVADGGVAFEGGEEREFDLLVGVAPHKPPAVLAGSGLTDGAPWIKVAPRTLDTGYEGVYAIGDNAHVPLANGKRLPMAGIFAEREGAVVAERISAGFEGGAAAAQFDGEGACFLEVGNGEAVFVRGSFLAEPGPQVEMTEASAANLAEKEAFERERLEGWFGV